MEVSAPTLADEPAVLECGLNIKRPELDYWLCSQSDASIVDDCKFIGFRKKEEDIILKVRHAGKDVEIKTRHPIGADRPLSRVRRDASEDFDRSLRLIPNYGE